MSGESNDQPIIIRKRKKSGHEHGHSTAWKVAMADFMTAMMAFFLVMWLVNQSDEVKHAVQGYFRDPVGYRADAGAGVLDGSSSIINSESPNLAAVRPDRDNNYLPSESEVRRFELMAQRIQKELAKTEVFKRLRENIKLEITPEGLRIILNEGDRAPSFFEPGSAKLLQKSAVILMTIARELGKLENRLVIEGHTSADAVGGRDYTNWELSSDRANSARALLEVSGLRRDQIREVRGFADQFPMIASNPDDARNRRITLLVLFRGAEARYNDIRVRAEAGDIRTSEQAAAEADS